MRRPVIIGNWKMNMTPAAAAELARALVPLMNDAEAEVAVCPPFVDIPAVAEALAGTNIGVGAQNVHFEQSGAYTGEIAPAMLAELGVKYAIVGHSERRQYFGETDGIVARRARAAFDAGITPVICVGETLAQREQGITDDFLAIQTRLALAPFSAEEVQGVIVAYEPVWAIGTGRTATAEQANETIGGIRSVIARMFGEEAAQTVRIQYGGSMNPKNAAELMACPEIDGGLIGGAALKADDFEKVVKYDGR